jgi:hypothetical protein
MVVVQDSNLAFTSRHRRVNLIWNFPWIGVKAILRSDDQRPGCDLSYGVRAQDGLVAEANEPPMMRRDAKLENDA